MAWTKEDIKNELESVIDTLEDIQTHYELYSGEADKEISEALDRVKDAVELL